jgi:hypothetical protein
MKQTAFRLAPWSGIGTVLAAAVFLVIGFILAIVLTILGGLALLPSWLHGARTRSRAPRAPRAPVTIEGRYSRQ